MPRERLAWRYRRIGGIASSSVSNRPGGQPNRRKAPRNRIELTPCTLATGTAGTRPQGGKGARHVGRLLAGWLAVAGRPAQPLAGGCRGMLAAGRKRMRHTGLTPGRRRLPLRAFPPRGPPPSRAGVKVGAPIRKCEPAIGCLRMRHS
jgi:hypothetical protein